MDIDAILAGMNAQSVDYLLIGGMNFLLNHRPEITYDVDLWVANSADNRVALSLALHDLGAEWGPTEASWGRTASDPSWLSRQSVYCMTTRHGALDIFFEVRGLEGQFLRCQKAAAVRHTSTGVPYRSLSDEDMLICQEALDLPQQKAARMDILKASIASHRSNP